MDRFGARRRYACGARQRSVQNGRGARFFSQSLTWIEPLRVNTLSGAPDASFQQRRGSAGSPRMPDASRFRRHARGGATHRFIAEWKSSRVSQSSPDGSRSATLCGRKKKKKKATHASFQIVKMRREPFGAGRGGAPTLATVRRISHPSYQPVKPDSGSNRFVIRAGHTNRRFSGSRGNA